MEIINVTVNLALNSRSFLFEDDTEVTVDFNGDVVDCDGLTHCDEARQKAIEERLGRSITV